jgi:hypothetical protein
VSNNSDTKSSYKTIIPTARNFLDFVTDAMNNKFRDNTDTDIVMPNLIQRAKLLVKRSGVLFLKTDKSRSDNAN